VSSLYVEITQAQELYVSSALSGLKAGGQQSSGTRWTSEMREQTLCFGVLVRL